MRNKELEQRLRTAAEHAAPDVLDRVLSSCAGQKGSVTVMETPKKKKFIPAFAAAAAVLAVICAAVLALAPRQRASAAAAVITLDVNPSLSLTVDENERVTEAVPLNDDGRVVLEDMDLQGASLNVAVNAVIGSMLQHGYLDLDNFENAILVSVESGDAGRADQLQRQVSETISGTFQGDNSIHPINPLILAQTVSADDDLAALAGQYGISQGKAALIREVTAQDGTLTFQTLAPLTINEIALIANSRGLSIRSVTQTGVASEAAYIGAQSALERACAGASVLLDGVLDPEVEFDCEDGVMVYEVEFCYDGTEYGCEIDARTGAVLHSHHEVCGHSSHHSGGHHGEAFVQPSAPAAPSASVSAPSAPPTLPTPSANVSVPSVPAQTPSAPAQAPSAPAQAPSAPSAAPTPEPLSYIGETAAQNAAFTHAGCAAADASYLTCKLEYDDGVAECYEVEFCLNGIWHEYEIGPYDGCVLQCGQETCTNSLHAHHSGQTSPDHHGSGHHSGQSYGQGQGQTRIGLAAARDAALAHAGLSAAGTSGLKAELDGDGNVYEVEFTAGGYEYEYEIDAYTGDVVKYETEADD